MVPSGLASAAVPEQRRRSPLELHRLQRLADSLRKSVERRRLTYALLLSLLIHTLLLSLTFGGQGFWGFGFPWQDRRIEVPDLRVVLLPEQVIAAEPEVTSVAEPLQQAGVEQPVASGPARTLSVSRAPIPRRAAAAIVPEANPRAEVNPRTDGATGVAPAQMPLPADQPGDTVAPPIPAPAVIAVERTDEPTWVVPVTPAIPRPVIAAAPSASSAGTAMPSLREAGDAARARIDREAGERAVELAKLDASKQEGQRQSEQLEAARQDTARVEAAKVEATQTDAAKIDAAKVDAAKIDAAKIEDAKIEATRVEATRVEAARVDAAKIEATQIEAAKIEAAKIEAARIEAAKIEAAKIEAAKIEAAKIEVARAEAARAEAARAEAARAEAARAEAARAEAARAEAARVEAGRVEAARVEAAQEAAARLEAARRAIGRQLDEEAARREAAAAAARLSPSSSSARRYRLFGRADSNAELILYAEAWSRKIELNMTFDMVREAAKERHTDPLVTVAIRSDGSVESVTFVQSSGVAAIDEAIRRIVRSQAPYQVFPPGLAREWDVIEIRRTWHFDVAIRLY
jgi:TonB family protein